MNQELGIMVCPQCKHSMKFIREEITNNGEAGDGFKEYKRKVYHCKKDDVWVSLEIPKND